ncbi:capsular polysaccharide type 8 biosynthesis protein cap8A [Oxobacter pfennigii]|uniref:Capsular polysaccharide type 8 biosynthesis protein cap8A n=1 Tax=Oxobacter pfennigii TaxID=36849 RepID=A0A0P8WRE5_9CLOT|nr:Wzz/FepE/Etk N-terminal domain-containing protein [Oxobacter pfennigii]KPU45155.1 capsular polysaccharide type 8 biosynthesis protein cap8A [Oxobacter pfennigii]
MELLEYLHIIRKRIWIIILVTLIAALASGLVSIFLLNPVYEAKATMIIGRTPNNDNERMQYNDVLMYQRLVKTYAEIIKSRLVADKALSQLKYDMTSNELQKNLTVLTKGDTQILELSVQDENPETAMMLANTIARVFEENAREMMNADDVKIMDYALMPTSPVKPRILLNIAIAAFVGLMLSLGISFLLEYLDNTIKTESDIERYLGITVLASIPYIDSKEK